MPHLRHARFHVLLASLLFCGAAVLRPITVTAQVDENDDLPAGLLGSYQAAGKTIERIDSGISFAWQDAAPDARLASGEFSAEWQGVLLVQAPGKYRLRSAMRAS